MKTGPIAENLYPRNLVFTSGLQALQIFAWNQVSATVTQFKDE